MIARSPSTALHTRLALASIVSIVALGQALAGGMAILNTVPTDDGDGDGYPDTRETVSFRLTVQNTTGGPLIGVTARLDTEDDALACLSVPAIVIGDLAAGEIKLTDPFVFSVSEADRAALSLGPYDELTATFGITFESASGPAPALPTTLLVDLDLDVSGGAGPTTFLESFEGTLGQFEIHNMDQGLDTNEAADGWRCQQHDPDAPNSNNLTYPYALDQCFPGMTPAHSDAVFWGLSGPAFSPEGGRGFTGFHSLFFGIDLGPPLQWTTPMSVLEATRTTNPIALGFAGAPPTLSFKHQVSFVDDLAIYYGQAFDRGVVMVQLADDRGDPVGSWIKLHPYQNPYTAAPPPGLGGACQFDPIDDGNTEDDYFEPTDPFRRFGPSSTCYPELAFTALGETSNPFAAGNVGSADGPGLAGQWGIGTWVESRFDLSRFRGRQVRVRFLASAIKTASDVEPWELWANWQELGEDAACCDNPESEDDGWWIDDVTIDHVLTSAATVSADTKDNGALPGSPGPDSDGDGMHDICDVCPFLVTDLTRDSDGDGAGDACDTCPHDPTSTDGTDFDGDDLCTDNCPYLINPNQSDFDLDGAGDACDCANQDPTVYPGAVEINDGKDNQCPGSPGYGVKDELSGTITFCNPADKNVLCWPAQQFATRYQVARAPEADFTLGCTALPLTPGLSIVDATPVPAGEVRFYLVRPRLPHPGSWGQNSAGQARTVPCAL